jgi:hypothetical protein
LAVKSTLVIFSVMAGSWQIGENFSRHDNRGRRAGLLSDGRGDGFWSRELLPLSEAGLEPPTKVGCTLWSV